jgi:hypothetical protein
VKIVETKEQGNYGIGLWLFQGIGVLKYWRVEVFG